MDEARITFQMMIAGNTLAGLTLVFLGNVVSGYQSYEREAKSSVRGEYRWRAWSAFCGFIASLATALVSFAHNWFPHTAVMAAGVLLLIVAVVFVIVSAVNTVRGIR